MFDNEDKATKDLLVVDVELDELTGETVSRKCRIFDCRRRAEVMGDRQLKSGKERLPNLLFTLFDCDVVEDKIHFSS